MARILWDTVDENDTNRHFYLTAGLFGFFINFGLCTFFPIGASTQAPFAGTANSPSHKFSEDQGYLLVSLLNFFFIMCDRNRPTSFIIIIGIFTKWNKVDNENQDQWKSSSGLFKIILFLLLLGNFSPFLLKTASFPLYRMSGPILLGMWYFHAVSENKWKSSCWYVLIRCFFKVVSYLWLE